MSESPLSAWRARRSQPDPGRPPASRRSCPPVWRCSDGDRASPSSSAAKEAWRANHTACPPAESPAGETGPLHVIIRPMKYLVWTAGCQMNDANSTRVAAALEGLGYHAGGVAGRGRRHRPEHVRRAPERRGQGLRLADLAPPAQAAPPGDGGQPDGLPGRRAGEDPALRRRFPYVDVFSPPSDVRPLVEHLRRADGRRGARYGCCSSATRCWTASGVAARGRARPAGGRPRPDRPAAARMPAPSASSPTGAASSAAARLRPSRPTCAPWPRQGVREVTLLGQIVDRYGKDLPDGPDARRPAARGCTPSTASSASAS